MTYPHLSEQRILITGGAARVGKAVAHHLASQGCAVAIHYRSSEDSARQMRQEFHERGVDCEIFQADLSEFDALADLVDRAEEALGPLTGLINNAAIWHPTPFKEVELDDWNQFFDINLRAPFFLAQRFAQIASGRPHAQLINMVDIFARRPLTEYAPYGMTKAALHYMTEVLAAELATDIRVNGIAPGVVLLSDDDDPDEDEALQKLEQNIPLGFRGSPEDVAQTIAFLLGGPAYITGEVIAVDGARRHITV